MKAGWTTKRLEELVEIRLGRTPPRAEKKFWDPTKATDNTWVSIADLSENEGGVITESKEHLSQPGADSTPLVKAGTLLVSFKLSLGKVAIAGKDLRTNEAIAAMPIKDRSLDVNWLKYFFQFFDWNKAAVGEEKVKGKALNKEKLKEIEIPLPPLAEQKRIVALLDEAFAGIDEAKAKTEANLENAGLLLKSYLNSTFSQAAAGWQEKTLGETCEMYQPKTIGMKDLVPDGPYPVFGANGIIGKYDKYNHEEPQLLITCRGATCGAVNISEPNSWITGNAMVVRPKDGEIDLQFLEYFFRGGVDISVAITGTAQPQITRTNLEPLIVRFPKSVSEQKNHVKVFKSLTDETCALANIYGQKLEMVNELKSSLLTQAFAGELTA